MITIFQVDAFTGSPFKGNPAGVCITEKALDDISMRNIAAEMNLSETAFAVPADSRAIDAAGRFSLRWFTPKCEVNLCGHATLAVAKVLYRIYNVRREHIIFETRSGELEISRKADFIQLDFPSGAPETVELPGYFRDALRLTDDEWSGMFTEARFCRKTGMVLLSFNSAEIIKNAAPNYSDLFVAEAAFGSRGVIITAADRNYDFISRFFAPGLGINEDPVTGVAHTVLAPYWAAKLGKNKMSGYQASRRGGEVFMELRGDRVILSGRAVIVMEAVMHLRS